MFSRILIISLFRLLIISIQQFHAALSFCLISSHSIFSITGSRCSVMRRSLLTMMPEGPEVRAMVENIKSYIGVKHRKGANPSPIRRLRRHPLPISAATSITAFKPGISAEEQDRQISDYDDMGVVTTNRLLLTNIEVLSGRYITQPLSSLSELLDRLPLAVNDINCKGKFIYFSLCSSFNDDISRNTSTSSGSIISQEKKDEAMPGLLSIWCTLGLQGNLRVEEADSLGITSTTVSNITDPSSALASAARYSSSGAKVSNSRALYDRVIFEFEHIYEGATLNATNYGTVTQQRSPPTIPRTLIIFSDKIGYGTLHISFSSAALVEKLNSLGHCWLSRSRYATKSGANDIFRRGLLCPPSVDSVAVEEGAGMEFSEFLRIAKLQKPTRPLAVFMMDQSKTAGIGNYILSEALYTASIHPWALCRDMSDTDWIRLYHALADIFSRSVASQIKHILPRTEYVWKVYMQDACPSGFKVLKETGLHKRSIHWVPQLQTQAAPKNPPQQSEVVTV